MYCRTATKKIPTSIAEKALMETEESVMATFDFLGSEHDVDDDDDDEENLRFAIRLKFIDNHTRLAKHLKKSCYLQRWR